MAHQLPTDLMQNGTGIMTGMAKWAFNVTNGWFWAMVLMGLCIVLGIGSSKYGTPRAFGFASFVGLLGATYLATMQLLSWGIASMFIVVGFIGVITLILNER